LSQVFENSVQDAILHSLVQYGKLSHESAQTSLLEARRQEQDITSYLVDHKLATEKEIISTCSQSYGVPAFELDCLDKSFLPEQILSEEFIVGKMVAPLFQRGQRLFVGIHTPTQLQILKEAEFETQMTIEPVLIEKTKLENLIRRNFSSIDSALSGMDSNALDNMNFSKGGQVDEDTSDIPIVQFINKILLDAVNNGASDVHFEPYTDTYRIRYRQDGILHEVFNPPVNIGNRIASRLKVMSNMNISERRIPQDGQITLRLSKHRRIGFRVSTCPTLHGEKIVLRLLNTSMANLSIGALGMNDKQLADYRSAIAKPYGMILVTGPTGSGKTVTQYSALNQLNEPERNILTIEDPVEIPMEGINQVSIHPKAGLNFASALRAFLRQDPDIIMVGEIRDLETAEIAIKAAQTGHLVFSTLHTNDAPQTLTRLSNMGVAPYNIASSVLIILAQRLVRVLCPNCKEPEPLPETTLLEQGITENEIREGVTLYKPVGCSRCTNGYRGRTGIYQIMPISEKMESLILEGGSTVDLERQAEAEGIMNLRQAGLEKVRQGITSMEELNRVTRD
jgi:type IV pilus assembly protein PilB